MHCPNCGTSTSNDQRFCRSCGLSLEQVSQLLADLLPTSQSEIYEQKRKTERWAHAALAIAIGIIASLLIFYVIIYNIMIVEGKYLAGGLLLLIFSAMALAILLLRQSSSLQKPAINLPSRQTNELADVRDKVMSLPATKSEYTASVTEKTTELLEKSDIGKSEIRHGEQADA